MEGVVAAVERRRRQIRVSPIAHDLVEIDHVIECRSRAIGWHEPPPKKKSFSDA
jgi:hypothetical protein